MITPAYVRTMAQYNRWQNGAIYAAADTLTDAQRKEHRGAFFGSIHATLNHILWADGIWLSRFGACAPPKSADLRGSTELYDGWDDLKRERAALDGTIGNWADDLSPADLDGDLVWFSAAAGREMRRSRGTVIAHIFNHQTHHRGQVHCLLTGFGATPGVTDLSFMPD